MEKIFNTAMSEMGLALPAAAVDRILKFFTLLRRKNEEINLISSKQDLETQIAVHLADSLTPLLLDDFPDILSALDMGSGGGLPGIPLSLARPGWRFTLVEAKAKKTSFLREVKEELNILNLSVKNEYLRPGLKDGEELYDLAAARALDSLDNLAALAGPRLKKGGFLLAFKGPRGDEELKESRKVALRWQLRLVKRMELVLPLTGAKRLLLLFEKG